MKLVKLVFAAAVTLMMGSAAFAQATTQDLNVPVLDATPKPNPTSQATVTSEGTPGACKDCDARNAMNSQTIGAAARRDGTPKAVNADGTVTAPVDGQQ